LLQCAAAAAWNQLANQPRPPLPPRPLPLASPLLLLHPRLPLHATALLETPQGQQVAPLLLRHRLFAHRIVPLDARQQWRLCRRLRTAHPHIWFRGWQLVACCLEHLRGGVRAPESAFHARPSAPICSAACAAAPPAPPEGASMQGARQPRLPGPPARLQCGQACSWPGAARTRHPPSWPPPAARPCTAVPRRTTAPPGPGPGRPAQRTSVRCCRG